MAQELDRKRALELLKLYKDSAELAQLRSDLAALLSRSYDGRTRTYTFTDEELTITVRNLNVIRIFP